MPARAPHTSLVHASRTDVGRSRSVNEDSHGSLRVSGGWLFVLADGMGGHRAGDQASQMAVGTIIEHYSGSRIKDPVARLNDAIGEAHRRILALQGESTGRELMGTTVIGLFIIDGRAHYSWVGDSRIYLVRDGSLCPITEDHTVGRELERRGMHQTLEDGYGGDRQKLARALGMPDQWEPEACAEPLALEPGDLLLLCSDGLFKMIPDADILSAVLAGNPEESAGKLIEMANAAGGRDNITVQVVQFGSREEAVEAAAREGQIGSLTMELMALGSIEEEEIETPAPPAKTEQLSPTPPPSEPKPAAPPAEPAPNPSAENTRLPSGRRKRVAREHVRQRQRNRMMIGVIVVLLLLVLAMLAAIVVLSIGLVISRSTDDVEWAVPAIEEVSVAPRSPLIDETVASIMAIQEHEACDDQYQLLRDNHSALTGDDAAYQQVCGRVYRCYHRTAEAQVDQFVAETTDKNARLARTAVGHVGRFIDPEPRADDRLRSVAVAVAMELGETETRAHRAQVQRWESVLRPKK